MQTQPLTTPFSPDEAQAARIIDAMTDPDISLRGIAIEHKVTLETLTLFLARPDIQERLHNLESAIARRTRLLATDSLPGAVTVLTNMLQAYMWEESKITVHPSDKKAVQQRRIAGESTRRAAALLYRLARFQAGAPVRHTSRPSTPKTQGQQTLGPTNPRAGPSAPTLDELLARIHQLDPTLLTATKTQGQQSLGLPIAHAGIQPPRSTPPDEPAAPAMPPAFDELRDTEDFAPAQHTADHEADELANDLDEGPDLEPDPFSDIPTDQLVHQARLAGAQLLRALGDTSPRAFYSDPAPQSAPGPGP